MNYIKLLDVTIDKKLNFHKHIAGLCRKISRQISVFNRFKCLIPLDAKLQLYHSFILSHLSNCSKVWHFCLKSNSDKLENYMNVLFKVFFRIRKTTINTP